MEFGQGGSPVTQPDAFNDVRWVRVGATPEQIDVLRDKFNELSYEDRVAENVRIASHPDGELAGELSSSEPEPAPLAQAAPSKSSTDSGVLPATATPATPNSAGQ